uniref:Uncharacterized protein n=1 Tax=Rhizophora mucronata TaxID=61149 RepID=A0A2P2P4C3_RHIMU
MKKRHETITRFTHIIGKIEQGNVHKPYNIS